MTERPRCEVCDEEFSDFEWERAHNLGASRVHEDCCPDDRCKDETT